MNQYNFNTGGMSQPIYISFQINFITASEVNIGRSDDVPFKKNFKYIKSGLRVY